MAKIVLTAGVQGNNDGQPFNARGGRQGDQLSSDLHGRYYEQTYRGNMFGIQGTAVTTTAAGAATFTGLAVGNPAGSGINMEVNIVSITQSAALTAATNIGVMFGPSTTAITASLTTIANRKVGGAASGCVATAGQTITSPTQWIIIGGSGSGAMTVPLLIPSLLYDFGGGLIIPPGYFLASYTSAASTTALSFYFQWQEVPI